MDQPKPAISQIGAMQALDVPDYAYIYGRIANAAVKTLNDLKNQPFFLAVGFWKPHLPYNAPQRWWHLYDRTKLCPPDHPARPRGARNNHDANFLTFHRWSMFRRLTRADDVSP